jgi:fluoroquinolone transport system ATP-binding protein
VLSSGRLGLRTAASILTIDSDRTIEVAGLRYTYPGGDAEVVRGLTFDVRAGEIFGFLGPSGAGKSTTQKILTGVVRGHAGMVRVFGRDLTELGRDYYERIGVSFEFPALYGKLTGVENLEFFRRLYRGRTEEPETLLARVGLSDAARRRAGEYSKGMKMRLGLCRALVHRPSLLFLDEPTTGQDPGNARLVKDLILEQRAGGATVFLTTHDMTVAAELCDRVAFIVVGEIVLVDAPRALMVRHGRRTVRVEYRDDGAVRAREFELDGLGTHAEFLTLLRERPIETIHTLDATLEDVFLRVTGARLS